MEDFSIFLQLNSDISLADFRKFSDSFGYDDIEEYTLNTEYLFLVKNNYPNLKVPCNFKFSGDYSLYINEEAHLPNTTYFIDKNLMDDYLTTFKVFNTSLEEYILNNKIPILTESELKAKIKDIKNSLLNNSYRFS